MRASTSGELVKDEVGHVPLRRWRRFWGAARRTAVSRRRDLRVATGSAVFAVILAVAQPPDAASAPGPDPHPSATKTAGTPLPDPAPQRNQVTPTPDAASGASSFSSATAPPAQPPPLAATASVQRTLAPEPKPRQVAKPKKVQATPKGSDDRVPPRTARGGVHESARVVPPSIAHVAVAKSATDPLVLGAFALLALALSSAGLLLFLHHSAASGARA